MKNYLCINGKKRELTAEEKKMLGIMEEPAISLSANGEMVKIGDYEFIVLKNDGERVELLLKGALGKDTSFGKTNDFKTSKVKGILDEFAKEIEKIVGVDNLLEHTVDLMALDGLKEYGSVNTKMSLLTVAQAQEHVELLDKYKLDAWWWLATPWGTPKHGYSEAVSCVSPRGLMYYYICDFFGDGVRPFCVLKSSIFVSCESEE